MPIVRKFQVNNIGNHLGVGEVNGKRVEKVIASMSGECVNDVRAPGEAPHGGSVSFSGVSMEDIASFAAGGFMKVTVEPWVDEKKAEKP